MALCTGTISEGFDKDHVKCEGNSIHVCGAFKSKEAGRTFVDSMTKEFTKEEQISVAFNGDSSEFCTDLPGKTITLTSHDWDKYDKTWGYGQWNVSAVGLQRVPETA